MGVSIAERFRTYKGKAIFFPRHRERLAVGIKTIGLENEIIEVVDQATQRLIENNFPLIDQDSDLEFSIVVTPGPTGNRSTKNSKPTIIVTTRELDFRQFRKIYSQGFSLQKIGIVETDAGSVPKEFKCRSRMHYWLAQRQAQSIDEESIPLLLDSDGFVAETPTSTIALKTSDEGIIVPPAKSILPGVSLEVAQQFFRKLDIPVVRRQFEPTEFIDADEVLSFSSPYFVAPVTQFDGHPVGSAWPGQIFRQLMTELEELSGVDLLKQAQNAGRGS